MIQRDRSSPRVLLHSAMRRESGFGIVLRDQYTSPPPKTQKLFLLGFFPLPKYSLLSANGDINSASIKSIRRYLHRQAPLTFDLLRDLHACNEFAYFDHSGAGSASAIITLTCARSASFASGANGARFAQRLRTFVEMEPPITFRHFAPYLRNFLSKCPL